MTKDVKNFYVQSINSQVSLRVKKPFLQAYSFTVPLKQQKQLIKSISVDLFFEFSFTPNKLLKIKIITNKKEKNNRKKTLKKRNKLNREIKITYKRKITLRPCITSSLYSKDKLNLKSFDPK